MAPEPTLDTLAERFELKALAEACLVLEEGEASAREIELGMMMGAGLVPGPFARADERGLDEVLAALERGEAEWGEQFAAPVVLRRLVAQGRTGRAAGQGFFAYARPDEGQEREHVALKTRGDVGIVWLDSPPTNPLSPELLAELGALWSEVDGRLRVVVIASTSLAAFCAGADIKAFARMDPAADGPRLLEAAHGLMRSMERSSTITIAAVNALALGGGCELAMACDLRIAGESASFGQPEVDLGIIPGFGGTQRLPRLVGEGRALEMNLGGEPIPAYEAEAIGLVNRVAPDHELLDAALAWARQLAGQAPIAVGAIKRVSAAADLDEGLASEAEAFTTAFSSEDAREGIAAFLGKREARFRGR